MDKNKINSYISDYLLNAARHQDLSLNPQKLAGQCAKLKCCMNFEVDAYVEASKKLPLTLTELPQRLRILSVYPVRTLLEFPLKQVRMSRLFWNIS